MGFTRFQKFQNEINDIEISTKLSLSAQIKLKINRNITQKVKKLKIFHMWINYFFKHSRNLAR